MMQMQKNSHIIWKNEIFIVEAIIDETLWDRKLINNLKEKINHILNVIYKIPNLININKNFSISLSFAGDKKIIELNNLYRKKNLPTNVLSFPSLTEINKEIFLGDIIFSAETIFKEAKKDDKSFNDHLIHLFIHSFLHLIGYDHQTKYNAKIMERLEIKILETLKIDNPYE